MGKGKVRPALEKGMAGAGKQIRLRRTSE